jgi:hypothetical protein
MNFDDNALWIKLYQGLMQELSNPSTETLIPLRDLMKMLSVLEDLEEI